MTAIWLIVIGGLIFAKLKQGHETVKMDIKKNFHVKEFGLKPGVWSAFCHLAAVRRVTQQRQVGEAIASFVERVKV